MTSRQGHRPNRSAKTLFSVGWRDDNIDILLVAGETDWSKAMTEYLRDETDMTVTHCTDAQRALDRFDAEREFECIVGEFDSLETSGLEFLATIRADAVDIPFVLCMRGESPQRTRQALRIGADDVVETDRVRRCQELLANRITTCVSAVRQEQSFETLRRAVESAGHAILITDRTGTITYANQAMVNISGYAGDELVGNTPAILTSGEHDEAFYTELWETILDGDIWQGEVVNERKDGKQYVINQTIAPVTDSSGSITGFIAINREVSERVERDRTLAFFEQAVGQIGTGMAAYTEDGIIQYANQAYADMLGTTPRALHGIHVASLNPEFDNDRFGEYWNSFALRETKQAETIHQRLDNNETFPVATITTHITVDDEDYHIGTIRDITERKERERELERQNERLEQFGKTVAHDLRNPLNVIRMNLEEAREAGDPEQSHKEIADTIEHMQTLIDELLMLAKQGQTVLDPSPASLDCLARRAWDRVQTGAMALTVTDDPTLLVDESRVSELFENLFRNAREHAGADARITVGSCQGGFYVADDGPGIPPEDRERVLESGFTTSKEGTGFGLSIVSQIAAAHDWTVAVTESESGGARFEFRDTET